MAAAPEVVPWQVVRRGEPPGEETPAKRRERQEGDALLPAVRQDPAKYSRYDAAIVDPMVAPAARAATLQLLAR